MASIGSAVATGVKALAFAALNKSDTLNAIADRITGGRINRDTLAQGVLRDAIRMGSDFAISSKSLGERSATLVPLARDALVDNDLSRMKSAIEGLVAEGLSSVMDTGEGGVLARMGKGAVQVAAQRAASAVGEALLGDHATEKVVATLVKQHGWQPLEGYLHRALDAYPGGSFLAGQVKAILQRTMVDKPEFDQRADAQYRLMAGELAQYLTGENDYRKPLRDYAPTLMAVGEGVEHFVREQVPMAIDTLQHTLVGPPTEVAVQQAYAQAIDQARALPPDQPLAPPLVARDLGAQTTERDLADALVKQTTVAQVTGHTVPSTEAMLEEIGLARRQGRLDDSRHEALAEVVDKLSDAQIRPLGQRGDIAVAHNWSGRLDRIETHSHSVTALSDDLAGSAKATLESASTDTTLVGSWRVGSGYAKVVGSLDLTLPEREYGYTDSALEGGRTALAYGLGTVGNWLGWGGGDVGPTHAQSTELRQLYNTCGGNEEALAVATRYLDPALAKAALVSPVLAQMHDAQSGLFDTGTARLQLQDADHPQYRFQVQREGNLITLGMDAVWTIDKFGPDPEHLRTPEGSGASRMTASAIITIRLDPEGGPPVVNHYPLGVLATVNNVLAFDLRSGQLAD